MRDIIEQAALGVTATIQRRNRRPFRMYCNRKRAADIAREAESRACLMCGRNFQSRGAGHRVCDSCKGTEA
jgi:hypothetical protein